MNMGIESVVMANTQGLSKTKSMISSGGIATAMPCNNHDNEGSNEAM